MERKQQQTHPAARNRTPVRKSRVRRTDSRRALQRVQQDPSSTTLADVQTLQRSMGNRATNRLLRPVLQRKAMTLGAVDDPLEREADRVADQVVRSMHAGPLRRQGAEEEEELQAKRAPAATPLRPMPQTFQKSMLGPLRRQGTEEEEELQTKREPGATPLRPMPQTFQKSMLQRRAAPDHGPEGGAVDRSVQNQINSARGGGSPLNDTIRGKMERGFNADFGSVRVHTDSRADALNRSLNARAFTTGSDVFFRKGAFDTSSTGGQRLLAHELTHTVQQGAADVRRKETIQRQITNINWNTADEARPSTSGVKGGVFFIRVNGVMHVVKATENVGATKFAENLVGLLGGAQIATTTSTPIPNSDNEFTAITTRLLQLMPQQPQQNAFDSDAEYQEAKRKYDIYKDKYDAFVQSDHLLVQQNMFTPGTEVLGVEDLAKALAETDDKGALQGRVVQDVQAQVNLLTNETLMKAVGRLFAIDTLMGNADRFEEMNVQNAFLRADNTVGAIDTEAIMQSMTGTKDFSLSDVGMGSVPSQGKSDIERYVDFVIGYHESGGGRMISDQGADAPSSNVARVMNHFDYWFEKMFVKKFVAWQDPMVTTAFHDLGFEEDGTGNWAAVKTKVRAGFDEGLEAIEAAMGGNQRQVIEQDFQAQATAFGEGDNFGWDAFQVRSEYMLAIKNGRSDQEARAAIVERLKTREYANLDSKVVRVLHFGVNQSLANAKDALRIRTLLQQVSTEKQRSMLHVSKRSKVGDKVRNQEKVKALNNRLEAARFAQLQRFYSLVIDQEQPIAEAIMHQEVQASRLRDKDVDQISYLTKGGRLRARSELSNAGVDVNRWGPPP